MVKGNNKKLFFYLLAFSLFINTLITADAEEPVKLISRKLLLFYETDKASKWQKDDLILLYNSLLVKLVQECKTTSLSEAPAKFMVSTTDADKSKLAARADCDAWLTVSIKPAKLDANNKSPSPTEAENERQDTAEGSTSPPPVRILVRAYDLVLKQEAFHLEWETADMRKIERLFWEELATVLNRSFKKIDEDQTAITAAYPLPDNCQVMIRAAPGTIITGLTETPLKIDNTGEIQLELSRNRTYTLHANCQGYFPLTETIYPFMLELTRTLNQQQTNHWAASFYLQNLSYPGLEATYFLNSQIWYLRTTLSIFYIGLPDWIITEQTAEPVADFTFSTGLYFLKPDNVIRFYTSLGCFLRIVERSQNYLIETNNLALLFGFYPVGGIEVSPYTRLRFYAEYTPLFYLYPSLSLERLVVELMAFNLGIRMLF